MVGLPAAGKTRWVQSYLTEHADERWIVVNAELMLEFMKVLNVLQVSSFNVLDKFRLMVIHENVFIKAVGTQLWDWLQKQVFVLSN